MHVYTHIYVYVCVYPYVCLVMLCIYVKKSIKQMKSEYVFVHFLNSSIIS